MSDITNKIETDTPDTTETGISSRKETGISYRTKTNLILIVAALLLTYCINNQINHFRRKGYLKTPYYSYISDYSNQVTFEDNAAPGMKAFAEYGDTRTPLPLLNEGSRSCTFSIPPEVLAAGKFKVYAMDRDGNQSGQKKLYSLEGRLFENNPS